MNSHIYPTHQHGMLIVLAAGRRRALEVWVLCQQNPELFETFRKALAVYNQETTPRICQHDKWRSALSPVVRQQLDAKGKLIDPFSTLRVLAPNSFPQLDG
ncbi:MAG: hypothetical protein WAZ18_04250 [Alphaproteobacteria bacterium]